MADRPEFLTAHELFKALCRGKCQWGFYFSIQYLPGDAGCEDVTWEEVAKAAPYLQIHETPVQVMAEGCGYFFGTAKEVNALFDQTVGDDGPTRVNPYNGPARVYALTCSPNGEFWNENT